MDKPTIDTDHLNLLRNAASEITSLRRQNELLAVKVETFDAMMLLFTSQPNFRSQPMAPDVVYQIRQITSQFE